MECALRVTKRTNIAMRVLMYCGLNEGRLVTKAEIAQRCNASENHLAQIINQLAQLGYLHTQRGRKGGLSLALPAAQISVGAIFRAIEKMTGISVVVKDFNIHSVTRGKDAQGEATIEAEHEGEIFRGRGVSTDSVEAATLAFLNVMNRIALRSPTDSTEKPKAV